MNEKENEVKLLKKIAEVTKEVQYVQKKGSNITQHYSYVRERDITAIVREQVLKQGLLLVTSQTGDSIIKEKEVKGKPVTFAIVTVEIKIIDIETGASMTINFDGTGADYGTGDKAIYKAITGAVKYCLLKMFMIESGDEDPTPNIPDVEQSDENFDILQWIKDNQAIYNRIKGLIAGGHMTDNEAKKMINDANGQNPVIIVELDRIRGEV